MRIVQFREENNEMKIKDGKKKSNMSSSTRVDLHEFEFRKTHSHSPIIQTKLGKHYNRFRRHDMHLD